MGNILDITKFCKPSRANSTLTECITEHPNNVCTSWVISVIVYRLKQAKAEAYTLPFHAKPFPEVCAPYHGSEEFAHFL